MRRDLAISAVLALLVFAALGRVAGHEFVTYDDPVYVTDNAHVRAGLTSSGVLWAIETVHGGNWHPLTWVSHMLDCALFGLAPGGHHLTSLVLHAANTVLLFFLLERMTSAPWSSAFVAALFGLHPLHVESVAWVAERKDLLSTLFWMLALLAYLGWVRQSRPGRYVFSLVLFALGLLAKPMVVTLPFVLLLLDYWPLARMQEPARAVRRCLLEKVPFIVLGAASSLITFFAQRAEGAVATVDELPLALRVENAPVAYVRYLGKTLLPQHLAVYYPLPPHWPAWQVAGSVAILVLTTVFTLGSARSRPYLLVGWLWFLVTLLPVIGLVQVGSQSMADRYTYVPLIGIFLSATWWAMDSVAGLPSASPFLASAACAVVAAAGTASWFQAAHWKDSVALFSHAVSVVPNNAITELGLGYALARQGKAAEAAPHYRDALRLAPDNFDANYWLANDLAQRGEFRAAAERYAAAARAKPGLPSVQNNLGIALMKQGRLEEAIAAYSEALRLDPGYARAANNLAGALASAGRTDEAKAHYLEAIRIDPAYAEAHINLGNLLVSQNRIAEAVAQYRDALRLRPDDSSVRAKLEAALARPAAPVDLGAAVH